MKLDSSQPLGVWSGESHLKKAEEAARTFGALGRWILPPQARIKPAEMTLEEFAACWEGLDDPRGGDATLHDFHEPLIIAPRAVLRGGESAVEMGLLAKAKAPLLRGFLKLAKGVPSHDWTAPLA